MKTILAALLLCFAANAAKWDGTRDDLTIFTVEINTATLGSIGIPSDLAPYTTEIFVKSSDRTVTAFRVTIEYTDAAGSHVEMRIASVGPYMALAFFGGVKASQVTSVSVVRLRDGETTVL